MRLSRRLSKRLSIVMEYPRPNRLWDVARARRGAPAVKACSVFASSYPVTLFELAGTDSVFETSAPRRARATSHNRLGRGYAIPPS